MENGRRLENISWRLWYRSTHFPVPCQEKNSSPMSTSFSKVLSTPMYENKSKKEIDIQIDNINENFLLASETHHIIGLDHVVSQELFRNDGFDQIVNQELLIELESSRDLSTVKLEKEKATFFLSDSCSIESIESIEMKRDVVEEDETDYSEDDDGFSYSTEWSWTPSPLFSKIPLLTEPRKKIVESVIPVKKSQLSVALDCNSRQEKTVESVHSHLSSSMKQTLIWDRSMPFNTKYSRDRQINEDWRSEDSAEYW